MRIVGAFAARVGQLAAESVRSSSKEASSRGTALASTTTIEEGDVRRAVARLRGTVVPLTARDLSSVTAVALNPAFCVQQLKSHSHN